MKQPPPAEKRRQPLPQHRPKPGSDDPEAPAKTRAVITSPSYRRADRDLDFLQRGDMRGLRLMLDYLKPQTSPTRLSCSAAPASRSPPPRNTPPRP